MLIRDVVRAQSLYFQNKIKTFVIKKLNNKLFEKLFYNVFTSKKITNTKITKKEIVKIAQNAIIQ